MAERFENGLYSRTGFVSGNVDRGAAERPCSRPWTTRSNLLSVLPLGYPRVLKRYVKRRVWTKIRAMASMETLERVHFRRYTRNVVGFGRQLRQTVLLTYRVISGMRRPMLSIEGINYPATYTMTYRRHGGSIAPCYTRRTPWRNERMNI